MRLHEQKAAERRCIFCYLFCRKNIFEPVKYFKVISILLMEVFLIFYGVENIPAKQNHCFHYTIYLSKIPKNLRVKITFDRYVAISTRGNLLISLLI